MFFTVIVIKNQLHCIQDKSMNAQLLQTSAEGVDAAWSCYTLTGDMTLSISCLDSISIQDFARDKYICCHSFVPHLSILNFTKWI